MTISEDYDALRIKAERIAMTTEDAGASSIIRELLSVLPQDHGEPVNPWAVPESQRFLKDGVWYPGCVYSGSRIPRLQA
jgi:hypothetical protein